MDMPQKTTAPAPSTALSSAMTAVELGLLGLPGFARLRGDRREAAARDILRRLAETGHLAGIPELTNPAAPAAA